MDELERLERERYGIFTLAGMLIFIGLFLWGKNIFLAIFFAIALALLLSGYYVASKLTSEYYWALLEAEARANGHSPSKRGTWLGNLIPGFVILLGTVYFNNV